MGKVVVRLAPSDRLQRRLQLFRLCSRQLVRPVPFGISVHADGRRRRERRRISERPRVRLLAIDRNGPRPGNGHEVAARERLARGKGLSGKAAGAACRAEQLPEPVELERVDVDLVQPDKGADAAAGDAVAAALQSTWRGRPAAARIERTARLGPAIFPGSVAALCSRL